jgi:hypothetical protein
MRFCTNKRAAISPLIADLWAFLVFTIVALAFFIVMKLGFIGSHIEYKVESSDYLTPKEMLNQITLQSYLRSHILIGGKDATVAELVAWSYNTNNYTALKQISNKLLSEFEYNMYICSAQGRDTWYGPGVYIDPKICPYKIANNPYLPNIRPVKQRIANIEMAEDQLLVEMRIK